MYKTYLDSESEYNLSRPNVEQELFKITLNIHT